MNIFIVDDSEDSRDITEAALFTAGYRDITSAGSAREAFTQLNLDRPTKPAVPIDLMLLDIVMPEIDGIELLARVRSALKLKAELERRLARERELLDFLSTWGDRRASLWIDEATGLLVGEIAEAYLTAVTERHAEEASIIALAIDRLDAFGSKHGDDAARQVVGQVALVVQQTTATVGVIAASYRNGLIVLVAPELGADAALHLAETLQADIAALAIPNSEAIAANHITASIAVTSGRVRSGGDRVQLLTRAIATAQKATANGGGRIVPVPIRTTGTTTTASTAGHET